MKKSIVVLFLCAVLLSFTGCVKKEKEVQYIGNRSVQYDETERGWRIFWAFYTDENSDPVKQEADISLEITNSNNECVYMQTVHVDESYYSVWRDNATNQDILLGCVLLPAELVEDGSADTGTLKLGAVLPNGNRFEEASLAISYLPLKAPVLWAADLPITITNYDGYNRKDTVAKITDIQYKYDGTTEVTITVTMTYNRAGNTKNSYVHVPYKLKDSRGVILESYFYLCGPMSVGDTVQCSMNMHDLRPGQNYTLEFTDYK